MMTDDFYGEVLRRAEQLFRKHQSRPKGQTVDVGDSLYFWVIAATMEKKGQLSVQQMSHLNEIGVFLHTEKPEPGQREDALEEYFRLHDSVQTKEDE